MNRLRNDLSASNRLRARTITRVLVRWYGRMARPLPWRRTHDPYRILVSEVMLQQTQASRVLVKYPEFLRRFPSIRSLARAAPAEIIRSWQGMGYNNRALNLGRLARRVVDEHGGRLPGDPGVLETLPGVGPYTARAVACFAFSRSVATVDTHIRRVLTRLFPREAKRIDIWNLARTLLPPRRAYEWNQGLMELGALICTSRNPACERCPLLSHCPSAHQTTHHPRRNGREPGRGGIPNRIYRGRIVEVLRQHPRTLSLPVLARLAVPDLQRKEQHWFHTLLAGLEQEGMVRQTTVRGVARIGLPER